MRRIAARSLLIAGLLALALASGCDSDDEPSPPPPREITRQGLARHLSALERIAERAGGERVAGTAGYRASADYVVGVLRRAGWRVREQSFPMAVWHERSPAQLTLANAGSLRPVRDFRVPTYAAAGSADGPLEVVDDACQTADFESLTPGAVAFTGFGGCLLWRKASNAQAAGAAALLVQTSAPGRGVASATLAVPRIGLPVALISKRVEAHDGERVRLSIDAVTEGGVSRNVIAEAGPGQGRVAMAGAHLDSVPGGPGINDDGSGVAALLELARSFGGRPPGRLRLAFWGAEEEGLIGSRHYVRGLSPGEREKIGAYVNLDMVGSPNALPAVYTDGDPELGRILRAAHPGREYAALTGDRSDHAPFRKAGIPVNGLYTGATEPGPGRRPRDACYHLPCDTTANVDMRVLLTMARAAAAALDRIAQAK